MHGIVNAGTPTQVHAVCQYQCTSTKPATPSREKPHTRCPDCTSDGCTRRECVHVQELTPDQVVALVSCTIWQERAEAGQKVREDMQGPYGALTEAARRVAKVSARLSCFAGFACPACFALQRRTQPSQEMCVLLQTPHVQVTVQDR